MKLYHAEPVYLDSETRAFYQNVLAILRESRLPFTVGGAYALAAYTGIARHTKDLDVFVSPTDCDNVLKIVGAGGFSGDLVFPHWLAKIWDREDFVDVIFSSGNGLCKVDETWFAHSVEGKVLGIPIRFCPVEEILWQKAFIMERERFDGADVAHLLRARGADLDWQRLLDRFGSHWRLLLSHLVMFGFVFPSHRSVIPKAVMEGLLDRLRVEETHRQPTARICQGTLLSRAQYLADLEDYRDARLPPGGNMTVANIRLWTDAIENEPSVARPN